MIFWKDLTRDHLLGKIKRILETPSYTENVREASALFRDQKEPPLERAVWLIEWALRHPAAKHLQSVGHDFSFIQLQSLDVLATIFAAILVVVWVLKRMICCILCRFMRKSGDDKVKRRKDKPE